MVYCIILPRAFLSSSLKLSSPFFCPLNFKFFQASEIKILISIGILHFHEAIRIFKIHSYFLLNIQYTCSTYLFFVKKTISSFQIKPE